MPLFGECTVKYVPACVHVHVPALTWAPMGSVATLTCIAGAAIGQYGVSCNAINTMMTMTTIQWHFLPQVEPVFGRSGACLQGATLKSLDKAVLSRVSKLWIAQPCGQ